MPILSYVASITAVLASAAQFSLWDSAIPKTAVLWLLLSGLGMVSVGTQRDRAVTDWWFAIGAGSCRSRSFA